MSEMERASEQRTWRRSVVAATALPPQRSGSSRSTGEQTKLARLVCDSVKHSRCSLYKLGRQRLWRRRGLVSSVIIVVVVTLVPRAKPERTRTCCLPTKRRGRPIDKPTERTVREPAESVRFKLLPLAE